jgi:hypothetical protein
MRKSFSLWRGVFYSFALLILLLIFSAYYAPDMMLAITNQVWALCGW